MADHGVSAVDLEALTGGRVLSGDPRAEALLDLAAAAVVDVIGWTPWPERDDVAVLDSVGTRLLTLPSTLVVGVHEVTVDGDPLPPEAFRWSSSGLIERVAGRWPEGYRRVVVRFRHGADVVPALQGVILQLAARLAVAPAGQTSVKAGGIAETYAAGLILDDERATLSRWSVLGGGPGV